jgi:F0F1-type ATP synthase membrane subunit b/b'
VKFDASLLVIMGIFWVAYLILRVSLFKPMLALLETREQRVSSARATHEKALAETEAEVDAQRGRLNAARTAAAARRDQQRREAANERQAVLGQTRQEAQQQLQAAQQELSATVEHEKVALDARARQLADRMTNVLLGKTA